MPLSRTLGKLILLDDLPGPQHGTEGAVQRLPNGLANTLKTGATIDVQAIHRGPCEWAVGFNDLVEGGSNVGRGRFSGIRESGCL